MPDLSIQLYTVRDHLADDPTATLRRLAQIGFTQVEPFNIVSTGPLIAEELVSLGLSAPTAHMRLLDADLEDVFATARRLGVKALIDPYIDPARWTSRADVAGIAADLARIADRAADHGLAIGYHNHAFELESRIEGTPALEVFADVLDDRVFLEVDTYWAEVGGVPAPELLERLGERVTAIHVKDGPITAEPKDQVAVGAGRMPVAAVLTAAPQALAVVELDDSHTDIFEAVAESHRFLTRQEA